MFVDAQAQAMKRMEESPQGSVPAPNVRLNVGGVTFDTTRDTLSKRRYFEPFLEGRFGHALDEHGRIFIDRSGALCGFLLDFCLLYTSASPRDLSTSRMPSSA